MPSKFLIQFYVEGLGSVPSLLSYYGGGNEDSGYQGGVICMSEVIDISPGNLDSCLYFIQPGIFHDELCMSVKKAGWQYTALTYSFPYLEPVCYLHVQFKLLLLDLHTDFSGGR